MLDVTQAKRDFISNIKDPQDTDETIQVAAVLKRHKETLGENDWLREGPPAESSSSLDNKSIDLPALKELKKLADHAVEEMEKRYQQDSLTMAILESLANGTTTPDITAQANAMLQMPTPFIEDILQEIQVTPQQEEEYTSEEDETLQETCFVPIAPKSDSGSNRIPTRYQNCTLSPYPLLIFAIIENRRYMGGDALPSNLFASDVLISQLHKDMKICTNRDFNGQSIPFTLLDGNVVDIPVLSAKQSLGVDLPIDMIWCLNGIS